MVSPQGPSGLTTDDGKLINYPDSYFFIMQKMGEEVINFTVKTDFSLFECRSALFRLTGNMLSPQASVEEYVEAISTFRPGSENGVSSVSDVVRILENVRLNDESPFAFENITWKEVYKDIAQGESLYAFNDKAQQLLNDFETYCTGKIRSKLELKKAVAATVLRISKLLLYEDDGTEEGVNSNMNFNADYAAPRLQPLTFGTVLEAVAQRPGCAGGGNQLNASNGTDRTYVQSVVVRAGTTAEVSSQQSKEKKTWKYTVGKCAIPLCEREPVLVGPCAICKDVCERKFDKGYVFKKGAWVKE
jgi:hypothetical protein